MTTRDFVLPAHAGSAEARRFTPLDPFVIAEIGVNHEGSVEKAKHLIDLAAGAGAHAAKFQTYTAEKLAAKSTSPAYWDTEKEPTSSQFELFKKLGTMDDDDYRELARYCADAGVAFMSTPFDLEAVDLLAPLMPAAKIASADLTNLPLIRRIRATGLPTIVSVGAATHDEIETAVAELLGEGATPPVPQLTLLHCVLNYPTPREAAQLGQIQVLQSVFGDRVSIGYSDHVRPEDDGTMPALEMAALAGAVVIEKHFTDDKTKPGNDHYHAMDPSDLARFMDRLALYRTLRGGTELDLGSQGAAIANARRRVVAARPLAAGQTIDESDLVALRSNVGIEIARWDEVVGARLSESVDEGAPIEWSAIRAG
jgi:sialic acid synthase SpsE